jgi:Asp-tRNA(Asn)/Glu-tRNA(Gln) amidotransferase A subunit family amidase
MLLPDDPARAFMPYPAAAVANAPLGPLAGLTLGVKDLYDVAGYPTSGGSPHVLALSGVKTRSAPVVERLVGAGARFVGKTITDELAFSLSGKNAHFGTPVNGGAPDRIPGGSSSGSAAAVAAGMLPLALGSQTGGSVIRPAAFCGVAGFKPSFRLLPTVGMKCFSWSLDTVGLFAKGVADAAFAAAAITGRDLRVDGRPPAAPVIAIVRANWDAASAAMQDAVERAARAAEKSGAKIKELELPPILAAATAAQRIVQDYEAFRALAFEYDRHRDRLGPVLRRQLDDAAAIGTDAYDDARRTTRRARKALLDHLADGEVMLSPSAPGAAPQGLGSTGEPTFNRLWTLLGTPCVNVPGLSDQAGLPLGVQIIARFGRDRFALAAAAFLEQAIGGDGAS